MERRTGGAADRVRGARAGRGAGGAAGAVAQAGVGGAALAALRRRERRAERVARRAHGAEPAARGRTGPGPPTRGRQGRTAWRPGTRALGKPPCDGVGTLACNGNNQKQTLLCQSGKWSAFTLATTPRTATLADGVCTDIVSDCAAHDPGYAWCVGDQLSVCGPDRARFAHDRLRGAVHRGRVSVTRPFAATERSRGRKSATDGNTVSGDGREADCKLSQVIALTAGASHTCALAARGAMRCWGDNSVGQLGLGTSAPST